MYRVKHKRDLFVLTIIQFVIYIVVLFIRPTHLITLFLVSFIPCLYLLKHQKHEKIKLILFSAIASVWMFGILDVLAVAGNAWHVQQVIPFRYLGISYIENIIWSFGFCLYTLLVYKHFLELDHDYKVSKNWKKLALILFIYNSVLYVTFSLNKSLLVFDYAYLALGVIILLPFCIFFYIHNRPLLLKTVPVWIYIAVNSLIYELIAVYIGNWWFPGKFIGSIRFLSVEFPLEEFIFWIILSAPSIICFYEYFIEDAK